VLDLLAAERQPVDSALERVIAERVDTLDASLGEPIRYALAAGGKRLRPILCMAAFRACGGAPTFAAWSAACALELVHTYSLMHDDLPCMDNDDLRRGRPTAHRIYGERRATLAAAAMIPLACSVLARSASALGLPPVEARAAVHDLTAGAGGAGMVGGQQLDLEAESRGVSVAELEAIHARKTGALFAAALRLGGRLARAAAPAIEALGECGGALGLAFQVTDDVLDVTGQASVLGKSAGKDRAQGKATYPGLLGVPGARAHAAAAAQRAVRVLQHAGIHDETLEVLIDFAVSRDR
jgi:geranylgeranyl diphosphate synthase type II